MNALLRCASFVLAMATLTCMGCLVNDEHAVSGIDPDTDLTPQGPLTQGPVLQGPILQGIAMNGVSLNGVRYNGALVGGFGVAQQLELRGGELIAFSGRVGMQRGEDLEGTLLDAELSNGTIVQMHIADVKPTDDDEIFEYTVNYWNGAAWANLCGEQNGEPVRALALSGHWDESSGTPTGGSHIDDPDLFTFACRNAVLAKCVVAGYAPWRSVTECVGDECQTIPMRPMHQACTRMMRADYCGDGTSHTVNGTLINVWDNHELQTKDVTLQVNWTDEAEWTPNGAACIQQVRWSGTAESYIDQHCPNRWVSQQFDCFSEDSTFYSKPGFQTPLSDRSLMRNQFTHDAP